MREEEDFAAIGEIKGVFAKNKKYRQKPRAFINLNLARPKETAQEKENLAGPRGDCQEWKEEGNFTTIKEVYRLHLRERKKEKKQSKWT